MLTLDEIETTAINIDVAREAHSQVTKRLEDALATKASHEQKAFALLRAYIAVALALFALFGVLATTTTSHEIAPIFLIAGMCYAVGTILCGFALLPKNYGVLGSDPSAWLRSGVIDGGEAALSASLAYEVFFHKERIAVSLAANKRKALWVRAGIWIGVVTPFLMGLAISWG